MASASAAVTAIWAASDTAIGKLSAVSNAASAASRALRGSAGSSASSARVAKPSAYTRISAPVSHPPAAEGGGVLSELGMVEVGFGVALQTGEFDSAATARQGFAERQIIVAFANRGGGISGREPGRAEIIAHGLWPLGDDSEREEFAERKSIPRRRRWHCVRQGNGLRNF